LKYQRVLFYLALIMIVFNANAQQPLDSKLYFIKKSSQSIQVDGEIGEIEWKGVQVAKDFVQFFPADSVFSNTKTEVMLTYDDHALYVAAICYDNFKGKNVVQSLKRDFDFSTSDAFTVIFDPLDDKVNGFQFSLNPYGAQQEAMIQNGGNFGNETRWDNKWFSSVKRSEGKWTLEMKIPFKTIRYKPGLDVWGVNFARNNQKINEVSCWNRVPLNFSVSSLGYTAPLKWDNPPPKPGLNASIIPYALGGYTADYQKQKDSPRWGAGGDVKFSLTPSLNLDLTINPDFSQVNVDQQITNLTRFNLFFPEQRQFFIENSDLFARFGFTKIRPFFSRRIGLKDGQAIPIIGGLRLSGKINRNWRIGIMNIQTAKSTLYNAEAQNYTVAAIQRQVFARSNIGIIIINRQGFTDRKLNFTDFNRVIGLDYDLLSKDNKWTGKFFVHHSFSPQKNNNAYTHASYLGYSTRKWNIMWNHEYVGKNYRTDLGFVPRQSFYNSQTNQTVNLTYWRLEPVLSYTIYPKSKKLYSADFNLYNSTYFDSSFSTNDVISTASIDLNFFNSASMSAGYNEQFTRLLFPIDLTLQGKNPLPAGGYAYRSGFIKFNSNRRKVFNYTINLYGGSFYTGTLLGGSATLGFRAQPWGNFSLRLTHDEVDLGPTYGRSSLTILGPTIEITPLKNLFFTTFIQYNTQINNLNINSRVQWRYAPMSDLFIVYTENYGTEKLNVNNRGIVIKLVYWLGI